MHNADIPTTRSLEIVRVRVDVDPGITRSVVLDDIKSMISRSIIDDNKFSILIGLNDNGINSFGDISRSIVCGYDDRDGHRRGNR
jgi:hypothetical protein